MSSTHLSPTKRSKHSMSKKVIELIKTIENEFIYLVLLRNCLIEYFINVEGICNAEDQLFLLSRPDYLRLFNTDEADFFQFPLTFIQDLRNSPKTLKEET